jgi:hypothetical protein
MIGVTILDIAVYILRLYLGAKVSKYGFTTFLFRVYVPCIVIGLICYWIVYYSTIGINNAYISIISSVAISCAIIPIIAYFIGVTSYERQLINKMLIGLKNKILK